MTRPSYYVTTTVNDHVIGEFMQPIEDPFVRQTVTVGWPDLLRALLRRRLVVVVRVGGDRKTVERVMEMNPDFLGGMNSPSRKAWNASLNERLRSFDPPESVQP